MRALRRRPAATPGLAPLGTARAPRAARPPSAARRWALVGVALGVLVGVLAFAPASWLASAVAARTNGYVQLADARGSVWSGSAIAVLTGGPGSRDARSLPGRLEWSLKPRIDGFELIVRHACCLNGDVALRVKPRMGGMVATLAPTPGWVAQWPANWLAGLGTPWNTLDLAGTLRLVAPTGIGIETGNGSWHLSGRAELELLDVSSRLVTLAPLGSYRLAVAGAPAGPGAELTLSTLDGSLMLLGSGTWQARRARFRGEARAAAGSEAALSNLLNIIGRRDGARAVISIG
ncbi:type II secretion system protein N [Piscinibacter koreensis]|uniref:Type II secretion system protein N n=1 Tax=Piscinibacter koreensis TaxID=2742824 RepID=A0A7Y6TW18_9BURK|nr:type II secretion system protein N [Schlegelella koreensis]NUZ05615.1 type II secretion system protein N [Schlegelella koreensis]